MQLPSRQKVYAFLILALVASALLLGGPGHAIFHMDDAGGDCHACHIAFDELAQAVLVVDAFDQASVVCEVVEEAVPQARHWAKLPSRAPPIG